MKVSTSLTSDLSIRRSQQVSMCDNNVISYCVTFPLSVDGLMSVSNIVMHNESPFYFKLRSFILRYKWQKIEFS